MQDNDKHNLGNSHRVMTQEMGPNISSYGNLNLVKVDVAGGQLQRAYNGDITAEEACDKIAADIRAQDPNLG